MSLRSDSPGSKRPGTKLVVVDAKKSTWTSYEGRAVASKVAVINPEDDDPESVKNFKEDLEGFRASAVAGADAKLDKEEEVFQSRFGYANKEVKSWMTPGEILIND